MTKKSSEKNKTWEKDRRNRLNKAFEELAKLLPQYDPTVTWSKLDILQKSVAYITTSQEKHEKLLESHDPKTSDVCKELLDALKFLRSRNNQLAELLTKTKISLPPAKFPKLITDNPLIFDDNLELKLRSVGGPKKNSIKNIGNKDKLLPKKGRDRKNQKRVDVKTVESTNDEVLKVTNGFANNCNTPTTAADKSEPTLATKSTEHAANNAIISTGVLIPVISCQPAILPQVNTSAVLAVENNPTGLPKCNILKIETLPRLKLPKKLARCKDGKVKILPYPVLKLHVRHSDAKIPIPSLKRNIITVKRKSTRKRKLSNSTNEKCGKKRKLSSSYSHKSIKNCSVEQKITNVTAAPYISEFNQNKHIFEDRNNLQAILQRQFPTNSDDASKIDHRLSLAENVLPDEYFTTLQMPEVNPNSTSVSPTAAFLLSFPVVNAGGGGKNISEAEESAENSQQKNISNINEGLENLNSFFKSKECYGYCNQSYDLSEKVLYDKIVTSNKCFQGSKLPPDRKPTAEVPIEKLPAVLPKPNNVQSKNIDFKFDATGRAEHLPKIGSCNVGKDMELSIGNAANCHPQTPLVPFDSNFKIYTIDSIANTSISSSTKQPNFSYMESLSQLDKPTSFTSKPTTSEFFISSLPTFSYSLANPNSSTNSQNHVQFVPQTLPPYDPLKSLSLNNEKNTMLPSYSFDKPILFPAANPGNSMKNSSQPTKINPIPNPIPAALPQPSNFPTNDNFYLNPENSSLSITNQTSDLISKSRGIFDVNSMFVNFPTNPSLIAPQVPQPPIDFIFDGKNKTNVQTPPNDNFTPSKFSSSSSTAQSAFPSVPPNYGISYLESSFLTEQAFSSFTQAAPAETMSGKFQPKDASFASASKHMSKAENLPGVITPSNTKNAAPSDLNTPKKLDPRIPTNISSMLFGIENTPQFPMSFPSTPNYGYSSILPEPNSTFTFNLTSTSTTPSTTMAVSSQSQTYFPYSAINQNTPLNTYPVTLDFQTPFTFSLTPTTSTDPLSVSTQTNVNSYTKPKFSVDGSMINKPFHAMPNTTFIPEFVLPTTSYSGSNLALNSPLANNKGTNSSGYPETTFSFTLTKPQSTTTTATACSEFSKPLSGCNTNEPKYQSFFNTYNYDSYSHVYPKETTTFTFALTNPTDTLVGTQQGVPKAAQPFSSTFSIETTMGAGKPFSFQNQQPHVEANLPTANPNLPTQQKDTEISKVTCPPSVTKISSVDQTQNEEKHMKTAQKSHVNWMTSYQTPVTVESTQHCPYFPAYSTADFTDKNAYFSHVATDDILSSWSPSKVIDTSHLFQSIPVNSYFNDINYSVANAGTPTKASVETQKVQQKSGDSGEKSAKVTAKSSDEASTSSQGKFLSVSQLVDQNVPSSSQTSEEHAKKCRESKGKDNRKDDNIPQDTCAQQKAASKNNYSAEALISKKEKQTNQLPPPLLHPLHNPDFYSTQNEPMNSMHQLMESDLANYNSNYYYNFIPSNQGFIQELDYSGTYPGDEVSEKGSSYYSRKSSCLPNASKLGKTLPTNAPYLPNLAIPRDNQTGPPGATIVPTLDSFETIQHGNNFPQSGNWYEVKNSIGNLTTPNEAILSTCNNSGTASTGNNLTNFNLSTICPEISEKVDSPNSNW